jgi:hypothetical protein
VDRRLIGAKNGARGVADALIRSNRTIIDKTSPSAGKAPAQQDSGHTHFRVDLPGDTEGSARTKTDERLRSGANPEGSDALLGVFDL